MNDRIGQIILVGIMSLVCVPMMGAESPSLLTAVGTVEKFEQETLTIVLQEKPRRSLALKRTGTSNCFVLTPQVRSGKTVLTQRTAEPGNLAAGQSIAVIYANVDGEHVLLTAVAKSLDKD